MIKPLRIFRLMKSRIGKSRLAKVSFIFLSYTFYFLISTLGIIANGSEYIGLIFAVIGLELFGLSVSIATFLPYFIEAEVQVIIPWGFSLYAQLTLPHQILGIMMVSLLSFVSAFIVFKVVRRILV